MNLHLYVDKEGFHWQPEGKAWSARFPSLRAAIRHHGTQLGNASAKLVVHTNTGKPTLELPLGT